jgi:hypothetical protein
MLSTLWEPGDLLLIYRPYFRANCEEERVFGCDRPAAAAEVGAGRGGGMVAREVRRPDSHLWDFVSSSLAPATSAPTPSFAPSFTSSAAAGNGQWMCPFHLLYGSVTVTSKIEIERRPSCPAGAARSVEAKSGKPSEHPPSASTSTSFSSSFSSSSSSVREGSQFLDSPTVPGMRGLDVTGRVLSIRFLVDSQVQGPGVVTEGRPTARKDASSSVYAGPELGAMEEGYSDAEDLDLVCEMWLHVMSHCAREDVDQQLQGQGRKQGQGQGQGQGSRGTSPPSPSLQLVRIRCRRKRLLSLSLGPTSTAALTTALTSSELSGTGECETGGLSTRPMVLPSLQAGQLVRVTGLTSLRFLPSTGAAGVAGPVPAVVTSYVDAASQSGTAARSSVPPATSCSWLSCVFGADAESEAHGVEALYPAAVFGPASSAGAGAGAGAQKGGGSAVAGESQTAPPSVVVLCKLPALATSPSLTHPWSLPLSYLAATTPTTTAATPDSDPRLQCGVSSSSACYAAPEGGCILVSACTLQPLHPSVRLLSQLTVTVGTGTTIRVSAGAGAGPSFGIGTELDLGYQLVRNIFV